MRKFTIQNRITDINTEAFQSYLKEVSAIKPFKPEEEMDCAIKAYNGDKKAQDELVQRNLRFVISVAKQYSNAQYPLNDLVNEGNIGLISAVQKFNPNTGNKFISYAVFWIRKTIMEHISEYGRLVHLPANRISDLAKFAKKMREFEQTHNSQITPDEMIHFYNNETNQESSDKKIKTIEEYNILTAFNGYNVQSLDSEFDNGNDNTTTLIDTISDESIFKATDHDLNYRDLKNQVSIGLDKLKPRNRKIMSALYGLDGDIPRSLSDLAEEYDISREMVRQIRDKSLRILRNEIPSYILY
jgi:RNA polymerase primary sigma factor